MAELSDFEQSQLDNNYKLSADKILQILDQVRNDADLSKRRWVWELLQNAKDLPNSWSGGVSVAIEWSDEALTFRHNGNPFTAKNLTSLVQQVSSKPSNSQDEDITGKFGTGFISTHLLADVIDVSGYVERPEDKHRRVEMKLDRSGKTSELLQASIKEALEKLPKDDHNPAFPLLTGYADARKEDELATAFRYKLLTPTNHATADGGIRDLVNTLPATLVNLHGKIKQVEVRHRNGVHEIYRCEKSQPADVAVPFAQYTVSVTTKGEESPKKQHCFVAHESEKPVKLRLLAQVNNFHDLELEDPSTGTQPLLYRDFPLIGTEHFYLPFTLNGRTFFPTERRDSVFLNSADADKPRHNREVLEAGHRAALALTNWLLEQPTKNRYVLANTRLPTGHMNAETLREWYEPLQRTWRSALLDLPLVETAKDTYASLRTVRIPRHRLLAGGTPKEEDNRELWELAKEYLGEEKVPAARLQVQWIAALGIEPEMNNWQLPLLLDIEQLVRMVAEHERLDDLPFGNDNTARLAWLKRLIAFLDKHGQFSLLNDVAALPNQENKLLMLGNLWVERENDAIPAPILDVLHSLSLPWRSELLHTDIKLPDDKHKDRGLHDASDAINDVLKGGSADVDALDASFLKRDDAPSILIRLLRLTSPSSRENTFRHQLFAYAKQLLQFDEGVLEVSNLGTFSFDKATELLAIHLNEQISACKSLEKLAKELRLPNAGSAKEWLSGYLSFLAKSPRFEPLLKVGDIVPNQLDDLCAYADLFNAGTDEQPLDETLLQILYDCDEAQYWKPKLLAKDVKLTLAERYTFDQLGNDLVSFANKVLYYEPQHEEYRDRMLRLLRWCLSDANKELARKYLTQFHDQAAGTYFNLTVQLNGRSEEVLQLMQHEHKLSDLAAIAESGVDVKQLRELADLKPNSEVLAQVVRNAKQLNDDFKSYQFLQRIGRLMEEAFAAALESEQIKVRIESEQSNEATIAQIDYKGIGSYDFVIHNDSSDQKKSFYIELKSYSTKQKQPIRLARSQAKRAALSNEPFALCVIGRDKRAEEVDEAYVKEKLVYVDDLQAPFAPIAANIIQIETLEKLPHVDAWLDMSAMRDSKVWVTHDFIEARQQSFDKLIQDIKAALQ